MNVARSRNAFDAVSHPLEKTRLVVNGRFLTQPTTGVQRYAQEIVWAMDGLLDQADYADRLDVCLLTPHGAPDARLRNIAQSAIGARGGYFWEQCELPGALNGRALFCPANMAPVAPLLLGKPVFVTVHDLAFRYFPEAYSAAFKAVYHAATPVIMAKARGVFTVSDTERKSLVSYYPRAADKIGVTPNGGWPRSPLDGAELTVEETAADLQRTRDIIAGAGGKIVLYVGSLNKRKNIDGALKAAASVLAHNDEARFIFVGSTAQALAEAERAPIDDPRIVFAGRVKSAQSLRLLYESAACFLFPSFFEASGLPPLEAMEAGCPAVVSAIPALQERCGDAAEYCDPSDPDDIARGVLSLLTDDAKRVRLSEAGRARAARFTWENTARLTLDAILAAMKS